MYCPGGAVHVGLRMDGDAKHAGNRQSSRFYRWASPHTNDGASELEQCNSIVCDYPVVLNIDAACAPVPR